MRASSLVVFAVIAFAACDDDLYCVDPDTGLRYPVNSTWPSSKFCGTYTCHESGIHRTISVEELLELYELAKGLKKAVLETELEMRRKERELQKSFYSENELSGNSFDLDGDHSCRCETTTADQPQTATESPPENSKTPQFVFEENNDDIEKYERIFAKMGHLGIPPPRELQAINRQRQTKPMRRYKRQIDNKKTFITVQGCPENLEPGYFRCGDPTKPFPECCPQKID